MAKTNTTTEKSGESTTTTTKAPRRSRAAAAVLEPNPGAGAPVEPQPEAGAQVQPKDGTGSQVQDVEPVRIPAGMQLPEGVEARVYNPSDLEPWPNLPTRDPKDYDPADPDMVELAGSMEAHAAASGLPYGNFEPVAVHPRPDGRGWIVAGRRRWTGAGIKGLKVLAIVREWTEAEAHVTALAENIHHKRISYLAEADEMALLRDTFGMEQEEIGAKIGKGQSYVSKRLAVRAMPAWVRAAIDREELSPSVAYDGFGVYVSVPEPAATELWSRAERWYTGARQSGRRPTAEQIRQAVGDIAVSPSRPMETNAAYRGEETPAFDAATHDAACECKRPRIAIQPLIREHSRCYNVPVWLRLQADAKEARSRELRERAKNGGSKGPKVEAPAPAPEAPQAAEPATQDQPTAAAEPVDGPAPMLPAWGVPTWAEYMAGREGRANDYCVAGDETPENMAEARRELVDWTALPVDCLHYVLAPAGEAEGVFRIVCDDAEAVKKARELATEKVKAAADVLREQAQAAFRKDVATVDERSAAALAVVLYELPQSGRIFVQDTARMLGIDFDSNATLDVFRKLPKNKLTLLFQGVAWRYQNKKTGGFYPDYAQQATQQLYAEQAADFAAVVDGLPKPEPTPAGRVQQLAGIVEARWNDMEEIVRPREAGAFADELSEYAPEWRLHVVGFRAAVEAVTETAEAAGVDPARVEHVHGEGTVAEMLVEARELLSHPILAQVETEAERQATAEAEQPQTQNAGQAPEQGAEAPAGEQEPAPAAEQPQDAVEAPGQGAEAPAVEQEPAPAAEQPQDAGKAPEQGAEAPAGEQEPAPAAEQPQDAVEAPEQGAEAPAEGENAGEQEPAPAHVEPDTDGVVRAEPGTRNVRGTKKNGGKKGKAGK